MIAKIKYETGNESRDTWLPIGPVCVNLFGREINSVALEYPKTDTKEYFFKKGELKKLADQASQKRKDNPGAMTVNARFLQTILQTKERRKEVRKKMLSSIRFITGEDGDFG